MIVHPEEKNLVVEEIDDTMQKHEEMLRQNSISEPVQNYDTMIENRREGSFKEAKGISFKSAWLIPGVI